MVIHEIQQEFANRAFASATVGSDHEQWVKLAAADKAIREVNELLPDFSEADGLTIGAMKRLVAQYEEGIL
jgi:hypothetical protein